MQDNRIVSHIVVVPMFEPIGTSHMDFHCAKGEMVSNPQACTRKIGSKSAIPTPWAFYLYGAPVGGFQMGGIKHLVMPHPL
jgi:hypothetical protein